MSAEGSDAHEDAHEDDRDAIEGAGGVVFDPDGRVLLIRQRSGEWVFPKGHLDPGEDHLTAALREVEEETGVSARRADRSRRWTTSYVNARGELRTITWFRLSADTGATPVMREKQFPEGAFVPVAEAMKRLAFAEDRRLLREVADRTRTAAGHDRRGAAGADAAGDGDPPVGSR